MKTLAALLLAFALVSGAVAPTASASPTASAMVSSSTVWRGGYYSPRRYRGGSGYYRPWGWGWSGGYYGPGWYRPRSYASVGWGYSYPTYSYGYYAPTYGYAPSPCYPTYSVPAYPTYVYYPSTCGVPSCGSTVSVGFGYTWR